MKHLRQIIIESVSLDDLIKRTKEFKPQFFDHHDQHAVHRDKTSIINHFAAGNQLHHVPWILGQYKKQNIRQEDTPEIRDTLNDFETYKPHLANKDLNSYQHIGDLRSAITTAKGVKDSKDYNHPDAPLVYNKNGYKAWHLKSEASSTHTRECFDNSWCTSRKGENLFKQHSKGLYLIKTPDDKHYQFHTASEQFADVNDKMHDPGELTTQHPEMKNFEFLKDHRFSNKPIEELMKDRDYHASIAAHGTNNHKTELLKRPDLNPRSHSRIAINGTDNHRTELLKRPDLDPVSHASIAIYGTNDHRTELLKRPDLNLDSLFSIAKRGTDNHRTELLKRPDLDPRVRKSIEDNYPHLINTRN